MKQTVHAAMYEIIVKECKNRGWNLSEISKLTGLKEKKIKSLKKNYLSEASLRKISLAFGNSPYWLELKAHEKIGCNDRNIYCITCIANNRKYFGSTYKKPELRWEEHLFMLKGNRHPVGLMQYDFNKYGEDSFVFNVMYMNVFRLMERECMYTNDTFNPNKGYNYLDITRGDHRHNIEKLKEISDKYNIELEQLTEGSYLKETKK